MKTLLIIIAEVAVVAITAYSVGRSCRTIKKIREVGDKCDQDLKNFKANLERLGM